MRLHAWILALVTCVLIVAGTSLVNGETWILRTDLWGNPAFSTTVEIERGIVHGDLDGNAVHGTLSHDGELSMTTNVTAVDIRCALDRTRPTISFRQCRR